MVCFPAACGDLITAVFDFAHGMCDLKLTEQQIALFSALVLINTGKINSPLPQLCCMLFLNIKKWEDALARVDYQQDEQHVTG